MSNSQHIWKNNKKLKTGYTTGSCAAGAAKAAAIMLLSDTTVTQVKVDTPKGVSLYLDVEHVNRGTDYVSCAIQKDSGDDPDVTNGVFVYARVEKSDIDGFVLKGGEGVGMVTKKGLEQKVGSPAINKVPRQMIEEGVIEICRQSDYFDDHNGIMVTISIPEGVTLASKTFNPKLGIEGGISVLGTTGIVEPMSEKALTDTIFLELKMKKENGHDFCYVVPGNYGSAFLKDTLGYDHDYSVKCSNYIGETIDFASRLNIKGLMFIGHIGKLIKVAAGIMNTHSAQADGRMEVLASHGAMAGADSELIKQIMDSTTTNQAVELLDNAGLLTPVMTTIMEKIEEHLNHRAGSELKVGAIVFLIDKGILGQTNNSNEILQAIKKENI